MITQGDNYLRLVCLAAVLAANAVTARAQTLTTIYTFTGGADGGGPKGTLIQGKDGNFYGTTSGPGTIFKITPDGMLTTLHTFAGADGVGVFGALALGNDGNFYGTTVGSTPGDGTVFKITPDGTFTTLHVFDGTDGISPWGGLVLGADGNFYGTTTSGGEYLLNSNVAIGAGTVFRIAPDGTFTNLYVFNTTEVENGQAGSDPIGALVRGSDGNFYGTTNIGGANLMGTVFKITPQGTLTILHSFDGTDGANPWGTLVAGNDRNFYGTTTIGGASSLGTVFQISPSGAFKTIYSFKGSDGIGPLSGLTLGTDGNFYGDTQNGGSGLLYGTIFEITPDGTLTEVHNFDDTDGAFPFGALTLGSDGSLYGTTDGGGTNGVGTVFKLSLAGGTNPFSISAGGIVDASNYKAPVAPGSIVAVFGTFPQITNQMTATTLPLPTAMSGVSLDFGNGVLAPMFFGSGLQINAQVPWELAGQSQATVTATAGGQSSAPQTLALATYAPGIFVVDTQTNQGAILDTNYRLISAANPAVGGDYVQIFCTGLGPVSNQPATGSPALSSPLSKTTVTAMVNIGGTTQEAEFSGLTPGDVGLYQVNVQVPMGVTGTAVPVSISIGGATSNTVTMAIQ